MSSIVNWSVVCACVQYATDLVNAPSDKVVEVLDAIVAAEKIDLDHPGNVFIAKDTRPSSEVRDVVHVPTDGPY